MPCKESLAHNSYDMNGFFIISCFEKRAQDKDERGKWVHVHLSQHSTWFSLQKKTFDLKKAFPG